MNKEKLKDLFKKDYAIGISYGSESRIYTGYEAQYIVMDFLKKALIKNIEKNIRCFFVEDGEVKEVSSNDLTEFIKALQKQIQVFSERATKQNAGENVVEY